MKQKQKDKLADNLPACAAEFIKLVIKKMRYRRKVRQDVQAELTAHFEDELKGCKADADREQKARQLIGEFGDVKLLAILLRRAKKRCRPLWRKVLVRSFQVVGVVILYILICSAPLVIGRPNVSVNYADWLNERSRAGRGESENAYPYYIKATAVSVKMTDGLLGRRVKCPTDFNDTEMQQLLQWITDNNKALELMIAGTKKPYYWAVRSAVGADFSQGAIMDEALMENLSGYRIIARVLNWRSLCKAYSGEIESALDDSVSLVRFGRHQQGKGLLIEQLVGVAIEALAHSSISMIIDKADVPADTLKDLQEKLQAEFAGPRDVINLDGEKVFMYDYIQRSFTDDGKGGGRMLARGLPVAVGNWKSGLWRFVTLNYPDRREVTAKVDNYYYLTEQVYDETPWQLHQKGESVKWEEIAGDSIFLKLLAPAHGRVVQLGWRMKTMRLGLLTVLALARYEKEKSEYPESLEVLVEAGYLKETPNDPYSDDSLVYKKTDESFILYSLGENLIDDEGQVARRDDGGIKQWASEGDWVLWPESESEVTQ